jgi:hypothetical protein
VILTIDVPLTIWPQAKKTHHRKAHFLVSEAVFQYSLRSNEERQDDRRRFQDGTLFEVREWVPGSIKVESGGGGIGKRGASLEP